MHRFLHRAIKLIEKHNYESTIDHKLCAIIVRGGNIVSIGYNSHNSNSFMERYSKYSKPNHYGTTHAECDAIIRANTENLKGCKIFVARKRSFSPGIARPCRLCQKALHDHGIKVAYYTITPKDETADEYGVLKIKNPKFVMDKTIKF